MISKVGEYFEVRRGMRQGCVIFPWLFNVFFDSVVTHVNERVTRRGVKTKR